MSKASRKIKMSGGEAQGRPASPPNETATSQKFTATNNGRNDSTDKTSSKSSSSAMIVIILLAAFAVYFNTLYNGFVYDDQLQVLENKWITNVRYLPDIFSTSVWDFQSERTSSNYYRPLMHIIYMFSYHVFGLKAWGFHLVNILFHAANSVLLFLIMAKLAGWQGGRPAIEQDGTIAATFISPPFIAAILFAVHPVHTEAVAWIGAVTDLSYTFFFLSSFYFYMRFREASTINKGRYSYAFSLISFPLALLCKEPAVVLPLVLFAYDFAFGSGGKSISFYLKRYVPYLVIAGIYFIVRINALGSFAPVKAHANLTLYESIINVFPLFSLYLEKLLLPVNLNAFHTLRPITSLMEFKGIIALAAAIAFIVTGIFAYRKNRTAFFGLALILAPLLPALYIPALGESPLAERYLYLPSAGFIVFIAALYIGQAKRLKRYGIAVTAVFILLAGAYSVQTIERNRIWKDNLTLFSDTVAKSPEGELPQGMLGNALLDLGRLDEAIEHYRIISMKLNPNSPQAHINLGFALKKKGLIKEAIEEYQMAVKIAPASVLARRSLVLAYEDAGLLDEAIEQYRILRDLTPDSAETHYRLGNALSKKGLITEAISSYLKALEINPDHVDAHYNLGTLFASSGNFDEALKHFLTAVRLRPDDAFYHNVLGITYGQKGLFDNAVEQFNEAVRLSPSESAYRENLERALRLTRSGRKTK
jgi:tetratricopeptide (TPR) repeat protein